MQLDLHLFFGFYFSIKAMREKQISIICSLEKNTLLQSNNFKIFQLDQLVKIVVVE
jgi:hypothetical protein